MQPENRDLAYLWDMREACQLIVKFLKNYTYDLYCRDKMVQSAVELSDPPNRLKQRLLRLSHDFILRRRLRLEPFPIGVKEQRH